MDTYMRPSDRPAVESVPRKRGPAYKRMPVLGRQKELHWHTFLLALGVTAAFFLPYIIMSHGYFFFRGDFNVQQIPFYQMCHQMVKEGNIFWNWQTDLGVNFIGSYSFYLLGSPFFWLTLPFPNWMVPYLVAPLLILKFACSAFTAYFYIRRFTRTPRAAMVGALLYAFSGFSIHNLFFNHFHEAIVFFPVLLLAVEQFIADNRRGALAVAVFICALSNYFFFFGMAVFCVIYWFIRMLTGCWSLSLGRLAAFAGEILLGVGMAAVILVPAYLSVMQNNRVSSISAGWGALLYGREQIYANILQSIFFPPEINGNPVMVPAAEVKWSSVAAWLPLFSMTGVIGFVRAKKGHWLRRVLLTLLVMAMIPILNSAFYAFNSAYYARWFYMPVLMMSLATAMSLEDRTVDWDRAFKQTAGATLLLILILAFFPAKLEDGRVTEWGLYLKDDGNGRAYLLQFAVICAVAAASLLLLRVLLPLRKKSPRRFAQAAALAVCAVTLGYGLYFIGNGKVSARAVDEDYIGRLVEGRGDLPGDSNGQYRIDVYDGLSNTGMFLGYQSIQAFHSIVPASVMDFYPFVGVERAVASRPETEIYGVRPLLSVKYLLCYSSRSFEENGKPKMPGYVFLEEQNGYKIYENQNYIPYGFTYDYYMDFAACQAYEKNDRALLMLKAVLLDEEQIQRHGDILTDLGRDYKVKGTAAAGVSPEDMTGLSAEEIMNRINDAQRDDPRKPLALSEEGMAADAAARAKTAAKSFAADSRGFTAEVELERENLVFFSVPYEKDGWTATVDGRPADIETVNVGFMAVRVPEGAHTVRFDYMTPGLKEGCLIAVGSLAVLLLYVLVVFLWRRRRPDRWLVAYPEGDTLARRFAADQAAEEVLLANAAEAIARKGAARKKAAGKDTAHSGAAHETAGKQAGQNAPPPPVPDDASPDSPNDPQERS